MDTLSRITLNTDVMGGKPCIRDMRVTVGMIAAGHTAIHWSDVGEKDATDETLMDWADENKHIVFTHDLDFGTLLALTHRKGPRVIQVRSQDVTPIYLEQHIVLALRQFESVLFKRAIVVVEEDKTRVKLLPFQFTEDGL